MDGLPDSIVHYYHFTL